MPITFRIEPERRTIRTKIEGALSADDVRAHFDVLLSEPACAGELFVFLDATGITHPPSTELIQSVGAQMDRSRNRFRFAAIAIVTKGLASYGMFRASQVLLEAFVGPTHVSRDVAEAETWFDAQRTGAK